MAEWLKLVEKFIQDFSKRWLEGKLQPGARIFQVGGWKTTKSLEPGSQKGGVVAVAISRARLLGLGHVDLAGYVQIVGKRAIR